MEGETYCFIMRHGERADSMKCYAYSYDIPFDPCLTPDGLKQAFKAASLVKPYVEQFPPEAIHVYCSPLLRCMQTASQVLIALGLENVLQIRVCSYLIEELFDIHFPIDPLKNAMVVKMPHDYISTQYLNGVDFIPEDKLPPLVYPEGYSAATQRFADGFYSILNQHQSQRGLILLVSHGRGIEEFNRYFGEIITAPSYYCGVSGVRRLGPGQPWQLFVTNKTADAPYPASHSERM